MSWRSRGIALIGIAGGLCLGVLARSAWQVPASANSTQSGIQPSLKLEPPIHEEEAPPRPSLDEILDLSSHDGMLLDLLGRFLPEATKDDLGTISTHWGNAFHNSSYLEEATWKLLLHRWVVMDPRGALALVDQLQGRAHSLRKLQRFCYMAWAEQDLQAALASAESSPNEGLPGMIDVIIEQDFNRAVPLLERFPEVPDIARKVLGKLAELDPAKALTMAKSLPSSVREPTLLSVLAVQAASHPEAALTETLKLDSLKTRSDAATAIMWDLADKDPDRAADLIDQIPAGEVRQKSFEMLARVMARRDPKAALAWAEQLPAGHERQSALAHSLGTLVARDPEMDLLAKLDELGWENVLPNPTSSLDVRTPRGGSSSGSSGSSGGDAGEIAHQAISKLAKDDPQRALSYLVKVPDKTLSDEDLRSQTAGNVIATWFEQDPIEALSALESLPSTDVRMEAAQKLAGTGIMIGNAG